MREFERITVDPQVHDGIACIRDTGITVSEVVSKVVHEKTVEAVLLEYPNLEAVDVQDALAYTIEDLRSSIMLWTSELLTPVITIKGYSELLPLSKFTPEQRGYFNEVISRNAQREIKLIHHFKLLTNFQYGQPRNYRERITLHNLLKDILQENSITLTKTLNTLEETQLSSNGYLPRIIDYLTSDFGFMLGLKPKSDINIHQSDKGTLSFSISRDLEYPTDAQQLTQSMLEWTQSPLWMAREILKQHGSELRIEFQESAVIFRFDLDVWEDSSK